MSGTDFNGTQSQPLGVPSREAFDALYAGTPPWDIGRPQPALVALGDAGAFRGKVLDVGCGTGEHALLAATLGLSATGIDISPTAIGIAEEKARQRSINARFLVFDAFDLPTLGEQFDTVIDSGVFHIFGDEDRTRYVEAVRRAMSPGGRYYLLCFSDRQPGEWGPRRVTREEIRTTFSGGWTVESIERVTMDLTIGPEGAEAWLAKIGRN